jgi:membrane-bound lytic murein transglycosylase D
VVGFVIDKTAKGLNMSHFPKFLLLIFLLSAGLLAACSPNPPLQKLTVVHQEPPMLVMEELTLDRALAQAESLCVIGTRANEEEEWSLAHRLFNEALDILAAMDLEAEESEDLTERFDLLLLTLSVEYPKALQHMEVLPGGSSLAMLLMRLGALLSDTSTAVPETTIVQAEEADSVTYDVPIHWNTRVKQSIHFFQTQSRQVFSQWLSRSGRYIPMMRRILREYDLPEDLVYLAMIESGFNPHAYSWAHAAGPWQFISSTARLYHLKADWWVDERRDPEKSTRAAARYLKDLYEEFASWPLALAAYNCGEQRVKSATKKAGTDDFWELSLPRQTRNYVPLFMAATAIAKSPELYDFSVEYEKPIEYDKVQIDECTDLRVVAECCEASYDQIKVLNPELRRWCTPPNYPGYQLKIPKGTGSTFLKNYALVPASEKITWQRHKIQRGETLSGIARRYGTSVSAIKEANSLRSSHRIIAGDHLLIPLSPISGLSGITMSSSTLASEGDETTSQKVIYTVRRGDNLFRIAREFGVSVAQLCRWNNLRSGQYIYPGNKLTVYPRASFGGSPGSSGSYTELIYTVKRGDTLWDIANDFGVSLASLIRENNLKDPSRIRPGKKLKIKMTSNL